jgi:hypothetical protein
MGDERRPRRAAAKNVNFYETHAAPSSSHYVGYVEEDETPEMIMKKFEQLERIQKETEAGTSHSLAGCPQCAGVPAHLALQTSHLTPPTSTRGPTSYPTLSSISSSISHPPLPHLVIFSSLVPRLSCPLLLLLSLCSPLSLHTPAVTSAHSPRPPRGLARRPLRSGTLLLLTGRSTPLFPHTLPPSSSSPWPHTRPLSSTRMPLGPLPPKPLARRGAGKRGLAVDGSIRHISVRHGRVSLWRFKIKVSKVSINL